MLVRKDRILFLDIETVPILEDFESMSVEHQALWRHKSKILDRDNGDFKSTFFSRAGIYSEFGKIVCIGLGAFHQEDGKEVFRVRTLKGDDEAEILKKFFSVCQDFFNDRQMFCGHNIKEFDIPYICRRGFINKLKLPQVLHNLQAQKPWDLPIIDTLHLWRFGDYKNYSSLELLAHVLDIPTPKDDMKGSDVARVYWKENNLDRIATYCSKDVITTARVYLKLNQEEIFTDDQIDQE